MNKRLSALIALPIILAGCSSAAVKPVNDQVITEKQNALCSALGDSQKMKQVYPDLLKQKWDRYAYGCGALYQYELAQDSWFGITLKAEALASQISYLDILSKQYPRIYQEGEAARELSKEWFATKARAESLISSLDRYDWLAAEIPLLHGAYLIVSVEKEATVKESFKVIPHARTLLQESVADDPAAGDALGYLLLGRLAMSLPTFFGGDIDKATDYFEKGVKQAPDNLEMLRWLTEAYLNQRQHEKANLALTDAVAVMARATINIQDKADLMTDLGGLALRLNRQDALGVFSAERQKLLSENPYLLDRKYHASLGHGGTDPVTGKDANEI